MVNDPTVLRRAGMKVYPTNSAEVAAPIPGTQRETSELRLVRGAESPLTARRAATYSVHGEDEPNLNQIRRRYRGGLHLRRYVDGARSDTRIFLLDGELHEIDGTSPRSGACRKERPACQHQHGRQMQPEEITEMTRGGRGIYAVQDGCLRRIDVIGDKVSKSTPRARAAWHERSMRSISPIVTTHWSAGSEWPGPTANG